MVYLSSIYTFVGLYKNFIMKTILLTSAAFALTLSLSAQDCGDIIISEYVEASSNNKAIELYNASDAPIDLGLGNYQFGRERNGNGIPMLMSITGIIQPGDVRVFALDKRNPDGTGLEAPIDAALEAAADTFVNPTYIETNSPFYFNGDDAFYLTKGTGAQQTLVDMIGKTAEDPGGGWSVPGDPNTSWWTEDNTLIRKPSVLQGVTMSPVVFDPSLQWDSLPNNTFDSLGFHRCACHLTIGVKEEIRSAFSVFPNPISRGEFAVKSSKQMTSFVVINGSGQIVREREFINGTYISVELPEVAPGIYMVVVEFEDGTRNFQKLIYR